MTRAQQPLVSDAVMGNVAVPDRHFRVGQQEPVDGSKQTGEQSDGWSPEDGGSGLGHRISLISGAAVAAFKF